jgi:hypothetical protein
MVVHQELERTLPPTGFPEHGGSPAREMRPTRQLIGNAVMRLAPGYKHLGVLAVAAENRVAVFPIRSATCTRAEGMSLRPRLFESSR